MSWKDGEYDDFGNKIKGGGIMSRPPDFMGGENFDARLDEMEFNRMIKLKNLSSEPQGASGKIYWDNENQKYKLWVNSINQWVDILWTSTSTSTTSTSTTSTSTTSTSTSTS